MNVVVGITAAIAADNKPYSHTFILARTHDHKSSHSHAHDHSSQNTCRLLPHLIESSDSRFYLTMHIHDFWLRMCVCITSFFDRTLLSNPMAAKAWHE